MLLLLLFGAVVVLFVAAPVVIRYSGSQAGPLPPTPADPVVVLSTGQRIAFAKGDLHTGDGLQCEGPGMRIGAWVPKRGITTHAQMNTIDGPIAFKITTRTDGVVIATCG